MAHIGLVSVDGIKKDRFPNLALMRISAYHKSIGDDVDWWWSWGEYDKVYMSKLFSDAFGPDIPDPINAKEIIRGGTGYAISNINGKEVYDASKDPKLPPEIEKMFPDYSIYPECNYAVAMTTRGCPRGCPFCHVAPKEGRASIKVANVDDFWNGQSYIQICDANLTACRDKRDLFQQYIDTNAKIDFNQGLDIRLLDQYDLQDLTTLRKRGNIERLHFAWDKPDDDLVPQFKEFAKAWGMKGGIANGVMVYVLVNYNSTMEQNMYRIMTLRELGFAPFVMIYDKPSAPYEILKLRRWVNNYKAFYKWSWDEYDESIINSRVKRRELKAAREQTEDTQIVGNWMEQGATND